MREHVAEVELDDTDIPKLHSVNGTLHLIIFLVMISYMFLLRVGRSLCRGFAKALRL